MEEFGGVGGGSSGDNGAASASKSDVTLRPGHTPTDAVTGKCPALLAPLFAIYP